MFYSRPKLCCERGGEVERGSPLGQNPISRVGEATKWVGAQRKRVPQQAGEQSIAPGKSLRHTGIKWPLFARHGVVGQGGAMGYTWVTSMEVNSPPSKPHSSTPPLSIHKKPRTSVVFCQHSLPAHTSTPIVLWEATPLTHMVTEKLSLSPVPRILLGPGQSMPPVPLAQARAGTQPSRSPGHNPGCA